MCIPFGKLKVLINLLVSSMNWNENNDHSHMRFLSASMESVTRIVSQNIRRSFAGVGGERLGTRLIARQEHIVALCIPARD